MQYGNYTVDILHGKRFTPRDVIEDMKNKGQRERQVESAEGSQVDEIVSDYNGRLTGMLEEKGLDMDITLSVDSTEGRVMAELLRDFDNAIGMARMMTSSPWTYF